MLVGRRLLARAAPAPHVAVAPSLPRPVWQLPTAMCRAGPSGGCALHPGAALPSAPGRCAAIRLFSGGTVRSPPGWSAAAAHLSALPPAPEVKPGNMNPASAALVREVTQAVRDVAAGVPGAVSPPSKELVAGVQAAMDFGLSPMPLVNLIAANISVLSVGTDLASLLLHTCVVCRDASAAVAVAEALQDKAVVPDLAACERALVFACVSGHHGATVRLFELMAANGMDVPQACIVAGMQSYASLGRGATVVRLLRQLVPADRPPPADMAALGLTPSVMESLITALCVSQKSVEAYGAFQVAREGGMKLSTQCVAALLSTQLSNPTTLAAVFQYAVRFDRLYDFSVREKIIEMLASLSNPAVLEPLIESIGVHLDPAGNRAGANTLLAVFGKVPPPSPPCLPAYLRWIWSYRRRGRRVDVERGRLSVAVVCVRVFIVPFDGAHTD
jgi:hypothetical protein